MFKAQLKGFTGLCGRGEDVDELKTSIINAFESLGVAMGKFAEAVRIVERNFSKFTTAIKIYSAPKSKIKHLALHAKKARTRKKNIKRLLEGMKE